MHNAPMRLFCSSEAAAAEDRIVFMHGSLPIGKAGELLRIGFPRQYQYVLRTNPYKKKVTYILSRSICVLP